uniref:Uncharacterized protein n=1 Tax=Capsella rubella TaxID=81985 RepID=K4FZQ8_9BRAS|nr:hypothetical protein 34G24.28 [Capsella rubella]
MASRKVLFNVHRIIRSTAVIGRSSVIPTPSNQTYPVIFRNGVDLGTRFFCVSPQNFDIDLSNEENKRRTINRLLYRSKQRGFLELDLVLGNWVEENVKSMDESGVKSLIHVLNLVFSALHEKVMKNLNKHAAPETRAAAGQPWVKGWDDFKRGRDAPISGNQ